MQYYNAGNTKNNSNEVAVNDAIYTPVSQRRTHAHLINNVAMKLILDSVELTPRIIKPTSKVDTLHCK